MPASTAFILRAVTLSPALIGTIAPCDFFDGNENLLLREGALISENIQKKLGNRRLFCNAQQATAILTDDPLRALVAIGKKLSLADAALSTNDSFSVEVCEELAESIYLNWQFDPDACIGFMRVANPGAPSVCQTILAALFVAELGVAHAFTRHEVISLIGSALTMNLGSMALHDEMANCAGPLPHSFRTLLMKHPNQAAEILLGVGVPEAWSRAVLQHHENLNGSGYPNGLSRGSIILEARMLRLVDIFAARQRMRRGRGPLYWSMSRARDLPGLTKQIFGADLDVLDISLTRLLMGRLGLFPPGTIVRLSNGEMAIVSRRSYDLTRATTLIPREVWSFLDANGQPHPVPCARLIKQRTGSRDFRILGYAHDDLPRLPTYDWPVIWGYSSQIQ
ncbi:MAG: hypothetical protein FWG26_02430 [Betaproteobacteria bacterium]|nr:hypothetical protein [Betaproteobacteria bacterium]